MDIFKFYFSILRPFKKLWASNKIVYGDFSTELHMNTGEFSLWAYKWFYNIHQTELSRTEMYANEQTDILGHLGGFQLHWPISKVEMKNKQ